MKRNNISDTLGRNKFIEHKQRVAFHEAGHAAGVHLNNKARQLPPVFFKIIFKDMSSMTDADTMDYQATDDDCIALVEGGRLIDSLPPSDSLTLDAMGQLVKAYMTAFEADIINLLIGPLAEARHVADTDDELFNHKLVNLKALKNYGGSSDLALVNEYLQRFSADKQQQDKKLNELFTAAFDFISNDANWIAITKLAGYILGSSKNIIYCEEIVLMLEQAVANFQNRQLKVRFH